jgi:hypothetical protein
LATRIVDIPRFYCFLRKGFLYDGQSHQAEFVNVCVFVVASIDYAPVGPAPRSAQVALCAKGLRSDDEPVRKPDLEIRAKGG